MAKHRGTTPYFANFALWNLPILAFRAGAATLYIRSSRTHNGRQNDAPAAGRAETAATARRAGGWCAKHEMTYGSLRPPGGIYSTTGRWATPTFGGKP
jgi:hypothetical protein